MTYNTGEIEPRARRWAHFLSLPLLLVIAWMLYELTAQPALAVIAVCVKFGWEDFRTAFWLRRSDPDRRRAWACCWLYFASGMWKMAITASLMIFAYVFLKLMDALGPRAKRHLAGALLTAFAGIVLATLTAWWSVGLAWYGKHRLWLSPTVHAARRNRRWPPMSRSQGYNVAGMLVGTSSFATLLPILTMAVVVAIAQTLGPIQQPGPAAWAVFGAVPCLLLVLPLLLLRLVRSVLAPRVFAASPSACWGAVVIEVEDKPVVTYVGDEVAASRMVSSWGEREAPAP